MIVDEQIILEEVHESYCKVSSMFFLSFAFLISLDMYICKLTSIKLKAKIILSSYIDINIY